MKKLLLPTLALLATTAFVYAQDANVSASAVAPTPAPKPLVNTSILRAQARPPMAKAPVMQANTKAALNTTAPAGESMGGAPAPAPMLLGAMTGNADVDEKIKALRKEFEGKMKALVDEYQAKAKVIIGSRPVTLPGQTNPATPDAAGNAKIEAEMKDKLLKAKTPEERASIEAEMKARMEAQMRARTDAAAAAGTTGKVTLPPVHMPVKLEKPEPSKEPANALQSFFRSLFGGNVAQVNAQVQ